MRALSKQNIIDILYGCAVMGTGGGGNLEEGLEMMEQDFREGKELLLADLSELPDDAYIAAPYGCGAPPALDAEEDEKYKKLPHIGYPSSILAFKSLEEFLGVKFFAVSSIELGGANTAEAFHVACQLGLPIMDSDPSGRSVPGLEHTSFFVKKKPITPLSVATDYGDVVIIRDAVDDFRAEDLARAIAVVSNSMVGVCDHPMTGKDFKESIIPGAITYAQEIGEILREARENGSNGEKTAKAIVEQKEGKMLFKGRIEKTPWEQRDGFNFGEIYLNGVEAYEGESYKICFKNENIISYRNDVVDVTVPDLICMLDASGKPVTTPNFEENMELNIFALPAPEIWTTEEGLKIFGPEAFDLGVEYVPFSCK